MPSNLEGTSAESQPKKNIEDINNRKNEENTSNKEKEEQTEERKKKSGADCRLAGHQKPIQTED